MFKKIVVAAVILLAGAWVVKKTQVCGYAAAFMKNGAESVRGQIPREVELARVKNEINQMDRDYQKLLRVIAEKMASTSNLTKEIATAEANRKEMAANLLTLSQAIEAKETPISYKGSNYSTVSKAEAKAARELTLLKQLDKGLSSKRKVLEAETRNLDALRDQLDKLVTQKREFEVRVAQLEADQAELDATITQTPLKTDEGRVAEIKKTLDMIEHGQTVERIQHDLENQYGSKIETSTAGSGSAQAITVQEIHDYLQGNTATSGKTSKVAQK